MQSRSRFVLGFVVAVASVGSPSEARAESAALVVDVDPGSDVVAEDVRRAVAAELGGAVAQTGDAAPKDARRLEVRSHGGVLLVVFHDARGRTIEREVAAPQNGADRVRLIALLAGNLARNEADELVTTEGATSAAPTAKPTDGAPSAVTLHAAPGEIVRAEIDARGALPTAAPPAPVAAPRGAWTDASPPPRAGSAQRTFGWISIGTGLAAGVLGLAELVSANRATDSLRSTCAPECTPGQMSGAQNRMVAADLLLGVGVLGTVGGVVLVLTAPGANTPVAIDVAGRSIRVVASF
jgi:hypothetical protein